MRVKDKVAIVTGGAAGIGLAIAERLAAEGASIAIADLNEAGAKEAAKAIEARGGRAGGFTIDVSKRDQAQALVRDVLAWAGRIDILVNNAGITRHRPFLEITGDDWDRVLDVDLKGVFFCAQAVAPHMTDRRSGKIVNISSSLGTGTTPLNTAGSPGGSSAYASAKAAVILLTKTLAREFGPYNINVNCVAPGTFLTAMSSTTRSPEQVVAHLKQRTKTVVLGRLGDISDLASAVLFLASDEASYITGHTLNVDGGRFDRM
jgi:NAD(P)-dependent dehydrogenase (short-subunit alcohol dehydrogenase family)